MFSDHWDFAGSGVPRQVYDKTGADWVARKFRCPDFGESIERVAKMHLEDV